MIYGHDDLQPASGDASGSTRQPANGRSWRALDSERRWAAIELALGHRPQAA